MTKSTIRARVIEAQKNKYRITTEKGEQYAVLSGKLLYNEEFPVVGDYVQAVCYDNSDALIISIEERTSYISRPDRGGHADGFVKTMVEQAMIANIDYLFIITSMNNDFSVNRIARYASVAAAGNAKAVAVLTKADICENSEEYISRVREINEKIEIVCVSSYTGYGIDELKKYFKPGVTIALLGSSGAGKSTLINTLAKKEVMGVGEIRESDSKGRHTTTHRQLIDIDGTYIIDTPGMRELGMCDVEEGIDDTFSDIAELATKCKFSDCSHGNEPGCVVRKALENGELAENRWQMYMQLQRENSWAKAMKRQKMISISKKRKELNSSK